MPSVLHVGVRGDGEVGDALGLLSSLPGYEHERFDFAGSPRGVSLVRARLLRRREFIARMRAADVVHVHGRAIALIYPMLLEEQPTIWTAHGVEAWWPRLSGVARLHCGEVLARNVDVILTASGAEAETLRETTPDLGPLLEVVPWGFPRVKRRPQARWELRKQLGIGDEITVLLLAELGDQRLALAAVDEARDADVDIAVLVAGGARELARMKLRQPHVHTASYEDHPDPFSMFAAADILLVPDVHRGYALSVLAAMDYGVAIVAGQSRSHGELLGNAAVLVPLEQSALTIALLDLIRQPARREYMAGEARRRAMQYSAPKFRAGILAAYERAMAAH
jgi:hypothetical protein